MIKYERDAGRAWLAAAPGLAADLLDRWQLRVDGSPMHGMAALVQPVVRADGTPAVLKLQPITEETVGEPVALLCWADAGAVRLIDHDTASGAMLLERLDETRTLSCVPDDMAALQTLSELLARLVAVPAPAGLRRLADVATGMLDQLSRAAATIADRPTRRLLTACADAVREIVAEPGDRLLHWDLHYDNVLATRSPASKDAWRAIDPKPLAGHPGFELLPALWNRWPDVVASGDVARAIRRRFDLMTEVLSLDRQRATSWTLGRVLQDALWNIEDGAAVFDPARAVIARVLLTGSASSDG